jgi:hypothetical protein
MDVFKKIAYPKSSGSSSFSLQKLRRVRFFLMEITAGKR